MNKKKILHGAGQVDNPFDYPDDYKEYWNAVESKPTLFMTYVQLKFVNKKWFELTKQQLKDFPKTTLIIGISMSDTPSGNPTEHYEQYVSSGKYDENLNELFSALKESKDPCFIRLGYEFNGLKWYGYKPKNFVKAWKHVVTKSREYKNNIKWVWHFSPEGEKNYKEYYPGDDFVDWWAISLFKPDDFKNSLAFIQDAKRHQKPVMIAESSPVLTGTDDKESWKWFVNYFEFIKDNKINAFCYINKNWSETTTWPNWKNCKLSSNKYLTKKYQEELVKLEGTQK